MDIEYFKRIHRNFVDELDLAHQKQKTSLPFILNTIPSSPLVRNGEIFQVIGIGGSIYHSAMLRKGKNNLHILNHVSGNLSLFITKDDLFSFLDKHIAPTISHLAINFAFAIEPIFESGKLDGVFISASKGHQFLGLLQKKVGCELEKYIFKKRKQHIKVSVANDTICLILSGLTKTTWDNLAAGIVGTGLNFAIFSDRQTIVNLEAGAFNRFKQTHTGKVVDRISNNRGEKLFEKEVSGAYLYQHVNHEIIERHISSPLLKVTAELSTLAALSGHELSYIAQEYLAQSARFVATQIAGIASFKKQPLTFIMQGSLFWKGYKYKEVVEETLAYLIPGYNISFLYVENSDLLGAAKLVA